MYFLCQSNDLRIILKKVKIFSELVMKIIVFVISTPLISEVGPFTIPLTFSSALSFFFSKGQKNVLGMMLTASRTNEEDFCGIDIDSH